MTSQADPEPLHSSRVLLSTRIFANARVCARARTRTCVCVATSEATFWRLEAPLTRATHTAHTGKQLPVAPQVAIGHWEGGGVGGGIERLCVSSHGGIEHLKGLVSSHQNKAPMS